MRDIQMVMEKSRIDELLESKVSRTKHKNLVCGVGSYDVTFPSKISIDGKRYRHRAFEVWRGMLRRCYCPHKEQDRKTYAGCMVSDAWLRFSGFLAFWKANYREGWQLDKDLLFPGNKIYSADRCVFVPPVLNSFVTDKEHAKAQYPKGVRLSAYATKFEARICLDGKRKSLGCFDTPQRAHLAWHAAKLDLITHWKSICDNIHPQLYSGIVAKVQSMLEVE
ncbi:hypothetical protein [Hafnia alvei]|uniref:hypothetical protein n=1 Tax=Hafnia alvei TaxID=569 RepID=UPI001E3A9BA9|nr:hypothetical protein [Hafnia alvei]